MSISKSDSNQVQFLHILNSLLFLLACQKHTAVAMQLNKVLWKNLHTTQQKPEQPPTYRMFLKPWNPQGLGANEAHSDLFGESIWVQAKKMVLSYFNLLTQTWLSVGCCLLQIELPLSSPSFNKSPQLPKHCEDVSFKEDLNPGHEK